MAIYGNFGIYRMEDGNLTISLIPPLPIGGQNIRFMMQRRFGGISGFNTKYCASGYGGGQSGITILNSGIGVFQITLNSPDTSGFNFGNSAWLCERLDSGSRTVLDYGFFTLGVNGLP